MYLILIDLRTHLIIHQNLNILSLYLTIIYSFMRIKNHQYQMQKELYITLNVHFLMLQYMVLNMQSYHLNIKIFPLFILIFILIIFKLISCFPLK